MEKHQLFPRTERLSIITAFIMLAYALMPFVQIPPRDISFKLFGVLINFRLNFSIVVSLIAAGLATSGMDWLLRDHPQATEKSLYPHYLLPGLTAWVIGIPLGLLTVSIQWWVVYGLGSLLLFSVLIAEYISMDSKDTRYPPALMVLNAVSYGLFLTLAIAIRASGMRLYLILFILVPTLALLCLRVFHLRMGEKWNLEWSAAITLVITQIAIGLHYLPLSPIRFGLVLLGPAYALISLAARMDENKPFSSRITEPIIMLILFWILAGLFS